jgi:hypothetical protein
VRPIHVLFSLLTAGCVSAPPSAELAAPSPRFDAFRFFAGRTQGEGEVRAIFSRKNALRVEGDGRLQADGTLILDQLIERGGAKPERRQWRIREAAPGRYRGTLSSATGPVVGRTDGNVLKLRYRLKQGGLEVRQRLTLEPGGRIAINRLTLRKFGLPVATVEETIRKVD